MASDAAKAKPKLILILSGKRKSGKDYVAERIVQRYGNEKAIILRLSGPLKYQYSKEHNLDFEKLLDASNYKEKYREDMIRWGETVRNKDPGYFCRHAISQQGADGGHWSIWVVSDARRLTDLNFFLHNYGNCVKTVRVHAGEAVRQSRGWSFVPGVDDVESECGLDIYNDWDFFINNEGNDDQELEHFLQQIQCHL